MSKPIRVVVADDSAFIRSIVCSHLESTDEFEVVGTAEDGQQAVELVRTLRPDVITLDVDMPIMSGIEALEQIMRNTPTPIVMVSGVSLRAAETTLRAIESGAVDFVLKYVPGVKTDPAALRLDIISKVRAAAGIHVVRTISKSGNRPLRTNERAPQANHGLRTAAAKPANSSVDQCSPQTPTRQSQLTPTTGPACEPSVVVLGASTGGPVAIKALLSHLPTEFAAPIIIIQHIPHPFTNVFATQLNCQLPFHASVAQGGERLRPRHIYIAPGDKHLLLNKQLRLELRDGPPICGHRPSIDVTMKSVAQVFRQTVYGILLTGMGSDGASGLQFIQSRGGQTFAQDSNSCVVDGMPRSAIALGAVNHIASPEGIADRLAMEVTRQQAEQLATRSREGAEPTPATTQRYNTSLQG